MQFGEHLTFRIGNKIFAIVSLESHTPFRISLKIRPESFANLLENEAIAQAPFAAKGKWVALRSWDALPAADLQTMIRVSYDLVKAGLPKKVQAELR